jgi:hypothetical protein
MAMATATGKAKVTGLAKRLAPPADFVPTKRKSKTTDYRTRVL